MLFYRPPNSAPAIFASIEDSIGIVFDCGIENILITGGFKHEILKEASNKNIVDICQHYSLEQLINEPTHSTENTHSIIDIFLTINLHSILLSRVGEPFLDQNIRYHCPIYCVFNFDKKTAHSYTRHIWLYGNADYQSLSHEISESDCNLFKDINVEIYATKVTERIMTLASKHKPNKTICVRNSDPSWLSKSIKRLMRKRKRLFDKYKKS